MSLEVQIEKRFTKFHLKVAFTTGEGLTGLLGASGCGKSMTLKCVAGLVTPDAGRIVLDGRVLFDVEKKIDLPPQERRVGYLFQNYALFPNMTVAQNIEAGARDRHRRRETAADLMARFQIGELAGKYPRQLSGGQQQRAALARVLVLSPEILVLDEPTSMLDVITQAQMVRLLREYQAAHDTAYIFITHNRTLCDSLCSRVYHVEQGIVEEEGVKL